MKNLRVTIIPEEVLLLVNLQMVRKLLLHTSLWEEV